MEDKQVIFNPTNKYFKSVIGSVKSGVGFRISILIKSEINPDKVFIKVYKDDLSDVNIVQMQKEESDVAHYDKYGVSLTLQSGLFWYYFIMDGVAYEGLIGASQNYEPMLFFENVQPWQLNVYNRSYPVPSSLDGGVMYHIFVDRFCSVGEVTPTDDKFLLPWGELPRYYDMDGNYRCRDFFGGNLKGVISKLDYIRSLGVSIIYLSPVFKAYSNNKYDTEDYMQIDSMFGSESDFEELIEKAREKNIGIVLDGVFNHSGSQSVYFNKNGKYGTGGAYQDKNSEYRDWYLFDDNGEYESWWGFENLPRFNAHSKGLQNFLCGEKGVVGYWTKKGIAGWRLDVVDEIADDMLNEIVRAVKTENSSAAVIGEVWEDASNKIDYGIRRSYFEGKQLDSVTNYHLRKSLLRFICTKDSRGLKKAVFELLNNYPREVLVRLMNPLSSHDTARLINELAADGSYLTRSQQANHVISDETRNNALKLCKLAAVVQYTIFGFPCLYYGDETGLDGDGDPFCRKCFPWDNVDGEHLAFYRKLGEIRNGSTALINGDFSLLHTNDSAFAFKRTDGKESVLVAVNTGNESVSFELDKKGIEQLSGECVEKRIEVPCGSAVIVKFV